MGEKGVGGGQKRLNERQQRNRVAAVNVWRGGGGRGGGGGGGGGGVVLWFLLSEGVLLFCVGLTFL